MLKAHIENELVLNEQESLVRICVNISDDKSQHYIGIVIHTPKGDISFREVESASSVNVENIFSKRALFNGRKAETVIKKENRTDLNGKNIVFT